MIPATFALFHRDVSMPRKLLVTKRWYFWLMCPFFGFNLITRKDLNPLARINDCLDVLHGSKNFTGSNLASGCWQIEMDENSKDKTGLLTLMVFRFKVMPFGLCNAPSTFLRMMNEALVELKFSIFTVYLDNA